MKIKTYSKSQNFIKTIVFCSVFVLFFYCGIPNVFAVNQNIGPGCTTAFYIDNDCDGYGVEAPNGSDCDDANPSKHIPIDHADAIANYIPDNGGDIFYIATDGDDMTGLKNDVTKPFKTLTAFKADVGGGDVIVYRGGVYNIYTDGYNISFSVARTIPITVMGYPGELVRIGRFIDENTISGAIAGGVGAEYGNMTFDNLIFENSSTGWDYAYSDNIIIKNSVARHMASRGLFGMQNLDHWRIQNSIFHDVLVAKDTSPSHGIYLGARDQPNSDIIIENSIMYRCRWTGFQHNGPISSGLIFRNNIIHSVDLTGLSLDNGVSNAVIENNAIFNNNKSPIVLQSNHQPDYGVIGIPITNNLFINNTLWVGKNEVGVGIATPENFHCVEFDMPLDNSYTESGRHSGNKFINNNCVSYGGAFFNYYNIADYYLTEFHNNTMYHTKPGNLMAVGATVTDGSHDAPYYAAYQWYFDTVFGGASAAVSGNINADQGFVATSLDYALLPGNFNFRLTEDSMAINTGINIPETPLHDITGASRVGVIDIGAYEYAESFDTTAPAMPQGLAVY